MATASEDTQPVGNSAAGSVQNSAEGSVESASEALSAAEALNATVVARQDLNDYLAIVRVAPRIGAAPAFKPGQFATLGLPRPPRAQEVELLQRYGKQARVRLVRRAYSIASAATERHYLELFVILVQEGKLTPRMWTLETGDGIWLSDEIKGEFTLDGVPPGRDLVMISTGTGLAPFLSMYRTYRGTGRWRRFVMVNGVRQVQDLGYRAELEQIAREDDTFAYLPLVSRARPEDGWTGLTGRVQQLLDGDTCARLAGTALDPAGSHVFLCGNPAMIDALYVALEQRGFALHTHDKPGNIHFERYW
jgi:ferredoxin--NADP+ reductase